MAIIANSKPRERKVLKEGSHLARCVGIVDIGTVTEEILGDTKTMHKVRLTWETPDETAVFSPESGEQPFFISHEYNLSTNEKASLRIHMEGWLGRKLTSTEVTSGFNVSDMVGKPCMISVVHNNNGYPKINSISALPKGMNCPAQVSEDAILDYDNWNQDVFDKQPDFIRNKMISSVEYKSRMGQEEKVEDNLPF